MRAIWRRPAWLLIVGAAFSTGGSATLGCSQPACSGPGCPDAGSDAASFCSGPNHPLADGGIGDPCRTSDDCGGGLECITLFLTSGYADPATVGACSDLCSGASCPAGAVCVQGAFLPDGGDGFLCMPQCLADGGCAESVRAAACVTQFENGDAGPSFCQPTVCGTLPNAFPCPPSYTCDLGHYCCDPGQTDCGQLDGWCRSGG